MEGGDGCKGEVGQTRAAQAPGRAPAHSAAPAKDRVASPSGRQGCVRPRPSRFDALIACEPTDARTVGCAHFQDRQQDEALIGFFYVVAVGGGWDVREGRGVCDVQREEKGERKGARRECVQRDRKSRRGTSRAGPLEAGLVLEGLDHALVDNLARRIRDLGQR
jgi:hypothetical protein